jgi:hypothetical protein
MQRSIFQAAVVMAALVGADVRVQAAGDETFTREASWELVTPAAAREQLLAFLKEQGLSEDDQTKAFANWPSTIDGLSGQDVLDLTIASLAGIDPRVEEIRAWCSAPSATIPQFKLFADESAHAFVRNNSSLYLARTFVQRDFADECLERLADLKPTDVVDPAGLLFQRAVAHHRLLQKEECLKQVAVLLEREAELPQRYLRLSHLMADDIRPLKTDSLDEVARLMEDVRRRLDHARAGKKVRDEEEEIVAKLDKMIEKLEEQQKQQQQQQQQQAGKANGKQPPKNPAQDSTPAELKAPGEVDIKNLGKKSGWGNLPPKERQEVLQQIGQELPAHFRETIEEYFQRLAQDGVK